MMFANKDINPVTTTMFVLEIAKKTLLKNLTKLIHQSKIQIFGMIRLMHS